ncbi:hCG2045789 [Anopheles sinensis]|uniref:HCG2045789 n=1 Tax=Anopheles sinensis TaxID=74873 RepID=A0A084WGM2_ANOSI|nr:hCG2045789 [Anopheles sinensis]
MAADDGRGRMDRWDFHRPNRCAQYPPQAHTLPPKMGKTTVAGLGGKKDKVTCEPRVTHFRYGYYFLR